MNKGQGVILREAYLGYTYAEYTGVMDNNRYLLEVSSGAILWLYADEFTVIN